LPLEPGAPLGSQVLFGELGGELGLALLDEMHAPVAVLIEGDRLRGRRRRRRGLRGQMRGAGEQGGGGDECATGHTVHRGSPNWP